ncbi:hypothetical protein BS47DRAFT_1365947 [Hydnum rufescens UP504]|uniref:Uncharacterized protein n=1 Tax=Hydnum rufescens UP504 TaxID=1448309 RepID=A0A9P6DNZ6_9AGAM|nr:hypothetical protein BS47DRAFT_1365947 [Hydnum rufescens UP504]
MYGISILAGKKHVKINAYHGTCKSLHACTAPEHATMGNVQHYTPAAVVPKPPHVMQQEVKHGTAHPLWRASSLHENLPDENTMKPRMKYGLPHTRSGSTKSAVGAALLVLPWATVHENTPGKNTGKAPYGIPLHSRPRPDCGPSPRTSGLRGCVVISDHPSWCKNTPSVSLGQAQFKLLTCAAAQNPIQMPHPAPNTVQYLTMDKTKYHTPAAADVWNGTRCTSPVLWGEFGLHFQY